MPGVELVNGNASPMTSVNCCVAAVPTPFEALTQKVVVPAGELVVLAIVAVPLPLSVNVTPVGSVAVFVHPAKFVFVKVAVGAPVVVTVKLPAVPVVKVVEVALLIVGATPEIVNVNFWVALGVSPLAALMQKMMLLVIGDAVVLAIVAVPSPLSVNVTPVGSVVVLVQFVKFALLNVGAG